MEKAISLVLLVLNSWVWLLAVLVAYLIGSIPTGFIIVKSKTGKDLRTIGSGSTGATNVKRVLGKKWFFIVMILDALKGFIPVFCAKYFLMLNDHLGLIPTLCAIAVIVGHSKPIYLWFKGGKSVATGIGTILALNWQVGLILAAIWAVITYVSKYVSLGSIIAMICAPFLMYVFKAPVLYVAYCALGAVYIIWLHRENISRLIKNQENKVRD